MRTKIPRELNSCFSKDKKMEKQVDERRRFKRYSLHSGLIFVDNDNLIGLAKVIDISSGGVRCASLSKTNCTICILKNIELFGTCEGMTLTELSGRMTRCSNDLSDPGSYLNSCYFEFGFEFSSGHYSQISKMKKFLSTEKKRIYLIDQSERSKAQLYSQKEDYT
jgi:hypothetical protein